MLNNSGRLSGALTLLPINFPTEFFFWSKIYVCHVDVKVGLKWKVTLHSDAINIKYTPAGRGAAKLIFARTTQGVKVFSSKFNSPISFSRSSSATVRETVHRMALGAEAERLAGGGCGGGTIDGGPHKSPYSSRAQHTHAPLTRQSCCRTRGHVQFCNSGLTIVSLYNYWVIDKLRHLDVLQSV